MILTISNKGPRGTDIGFLLHKNPANLHLADTAFGKAHVFYASATADRCTACLLLEIDPVELVRGAQRLEVEIADEAAIESAPPWWEELTGRGGEGMVVKPLDFVARGPKGMVQPAPKGRGRDLRSGVYG